MPIKSKFLSQKKFYNEFIEWLSDNIQNLMRLHLLGGETFIQHELISDIFKIIEKIFAGVDCLL